MKLKDLLSKIGRNHFYLMHLSWNEGKARRETLWKYALREGLIGLDYYNPNINRKWSEVPEHKKNKLSGGWNGWRRQFELFCERMMVGDCVLVMEGETHLRGVGIVDGPYSFEKELEDDFFRHVHQVKWIDDKYKKPVSFKVDGSDNTICFINSDSRRWRLVNREIEVKDKELVLRELEPIVKRLRPGKQEIERAKDKLRLRGPAVKIEIEREINTLMSQGPAELPRTLKRRSIIKAGSKSVDIDAEVNLVKSDVQIDINPVYVPRSLSASTIEGFKDDAREFRRLISKIERIFGISGFTMICIDDTPSRDAFGFKRCTLCNLIQYQKQKSPSFWLITLAREFAYLIHPRRDMKHMNLMRELLVKALDKSLQNL